MNEPKPPSEPDYLTRQAEEAKAAMSHLVAQIQANLKDSADPRLWAREYPWLTVGSAAAAGFLAAFGLVPSKEQQALERLARIERAITPPPVEVADGHPHARDASEASSLMGRVARELMGLLKPVLMSALAAGVRARVARPDEAQSAESENQTA